MLLGHFGVIFKLFSSCHFKEDETKSNCFGDNLKHYVLAFAVLNLVFSLAKMFQDKAYLCNINLWRHRTEDLFYIVIFGLVLADYLIEDSGDEEKKIHRIIAAFMVIISCRIMMHTFARNPDVAIVSEMVDHIRSSLLKFFFSYIFIFLGWIVAFHVTLGTVFENFIKSLIQHCERSELCLHFFNAKNWWKMPKLIM